MLAAPREHISVHLRGVTIVQNQKPANTTKHTRMNSWKFIIALDKEREAKGDLFMDDGVSLEPADTKEVTVSSLLHLFAFVFGPLKID
jgi:alpha-glucosidase